jgi:thiol reductant ABC exporter CydC subunit
MLPFKWWIALAVLLSFATLGASVGLMAMSAYLISKAALSTGFADLAVAVTAVRAFAIARAALRYAERYITHRATFHILARLRVWFYTAIEPLAPARLQTVHSGDVFTRIGADIETLENFYIRVIVPPLAAVLVVAFACVLLGAFDWALALTLAIFSILVGIVLPVVTLRASRSPAAALLATRAQLNAHLTDQIQGIADVIAYSQTQNFSRRTIALGKQLDDIQLRLAHWRGMSSALAVLLASLAGLTILTLAIPLVTQGKIEGVFLALLPLAAIASFEATQPLGAAFQQLETSQAAARRLFELMDAPPPSPDPSQPLAPPTRLDIEFQHVRFAYAPDDALTLDDVSFHIPHGERLVLRGASGAGKSTLVNLLARFWDAQAGQIYIGGSDVRAMRGEDVRQLLGVASQYPYLFNGTLRDNFLVAKGDATDAEILDACCLAQLQDFVAALPNGLDTRVGENGMKLSGGERQRVAIARVILKNAPILILDEATANLDAHTEQQLWRALEPFLQTRTTLVISHRPVKFEIPAPTLYLENGRMVPAPPAN